MHASVHFTSLHTLLDGQLRRQLPHCQPQTQLRTPDLFHNTEQLSLCIVYPKISPKKMHEQCKTQTTASGIRPGLSTNCTTGYV